MMLLIIAIEYQWAGLCTHVSEISEHGFKILDRVYIFSYGFNRLVSGSL